MSLSQRSHPLADVELTESARWYEEAQPGLGDDFLDAASEAVELILEWPRVGSVIPGWNREPVVRSKAIERFPYRVLYYLTDTELMVVAFAHTRRKPGYWKDRV